MVSYNIEAKRPLSAFTYNKRTFQPTQAERSNGPQEYVRSVLEMRPSVAHSWIYLVV